ncbi:cytochrome P450 71A9-like [Papaver somniferum]|uniref:cytochrome P450 71A9-like n=1 Tax=Papaver somniferum TaxID=3469 RepID=UPI000E6FF5DC|nr:cytochrome P450 71A9-like [Papaver somniferum]
MRSRYYDNYCYHFMILLLVFAASLLVLWWRKNRKERNGMRRLPPGPRRFPLIGNLLQLGNELPHVSLQMLSNKYGPLMFLKLGSIPTLVVSSADMAKEILTKHDLVCSNRPMFYAPRKLSYGCSDITFSPYGDYFREVKKMAVSELLSAKKVLSCRAVREEEVALAFNLMRTSSSSSVPINLSEILLCLINNVVCRVAFGIKYVDDEQDEDGKNKIYMIFQETLNLLAGFNAADLFPWMSWIYRFDGLDARLEKNFRHMDEFYDKIIDEHINGSKSSKTGGDEDFVDVLLRVQKDPSHSISLSRDNIKAILMDMFIAGTDTSAVILVWTMTELIRNPTIMKIAQEEVRSEIGFKEMVEESDLRKLSYIKLVIKEAFRLHPPSPLLVPRETSENCRINGYDIPIKTSVLINAKAISTDPKYWENPNEFLPERFLDSNIDYKGQDFELIPFGGGRRRCPGISFSAVLIELVLANLLHCFDWKLPSGMKIEEFDMSEAFGLAVHKKIPLCLLADSRK